MLFVTLFKVKSGTLKERIARRLQWQYPEGLKMVGEYWLQTDDPTAIAIYEADSVAPIIAGRSYWDDVFETTTIPAITAEEGLELARQMQQPG